MKLYKEILIETAEQAEALPWGTIAKNEATTGSGTWYAPPRVNIGRGMWSGDDLYRSVDMVGCTALVPTEAEEEARPAWIHVGQIVAHQTAHGTAYGAEFDGQTGQPASWERRLVTPWEPADRITP